MPYLFSVNETNRHICIQNRIFGVPNTERARSQIMNVRKGEKLFLYVYGTGLVYGIFEAATDPFIQKNPENGPWNLSPIDKKHGFYPYRLYIKIIKSYQTGVLFKKLESLNIGLDFSLLQRKSAWTCPSLMDTCKCGIIIPPGGVPWNETASVKVTAVNLN